MSIEEEEETTLPNTTAHKRGRPRKSPSAAQKQTPPLSILQQLNAQTQQQQMTEKSPFDKPREELSYKDFFPDLDIREPLAIIKVPETSLRQVVHHTPSALTPKSPSMDEYETASEGESPSVATTTTTMPLHKLPTPSYQKIKPQKQKNKKEEGSAVQTFHRPENHYIRYAGKWHQCIL